MIFDQSEHVRFDARPDSEREFYLDKARLRRSRILTCSLIRLSQSEMVRHLIYTVAVLVAFAVSKSILRPSLLDIFPRRMQPMLTFMFGTHKLDVRAAPQFY